MKQNNTKCSFLSFYLSRLCTVIEMLIPYYGKGVRFRVLLRIREICRKKNLYFLGVCIKGYLQNHYGCEISINATISPKAQFIHTVGVVIGEGSIIEDGVIIYSGVVLGRKDIKVEAYPHIKSNSILCTGACLLGGITVGDNCVIGAKSLVLRDCAPNSTYVGCPAINISNK